MAKIDEVDSIKKLWVEDNIEAKFIQASESAVYSLKGDNTDLILRLTKGSLKNKSFIESELDYLLYLHDNGLRVSIPVKSKNGNYIETLTDEDESYSMVAFIPAKGTKVEYKSENWNETFFKKWGAFLGKMHNLSEEYTPANGFSRWNWRDDKIFNRKDEILNSSEGTEASKEYKKLEEEIASFTQDQKEFGLIHGDFCTPNFFYDGGIITAFDFDDSCYHWFMYDIAVSLWPTRFLPDDERQNYLNWLIKGYLQERTVEQKWLERIPVFIRLRNLYMFIYRMIYIDNFTIEQKGQWLKRMKESFIKPPQWELKID